MTKAVDILANTRIDKGYTLAEIAKISKVSLRYLEAIEAGDLNLLPPEPYNYLIIKDYAHFLGLNGDDLVRLYRRDFQKLAPVSVPTRLKHQVTPQFVFRLLTVLTFLTFVFYLAWQYYDYERPPHLDVAWPDPSLVVDNDILITGATDVSATIKINDQLVIVNPEGNFEYRLKPTKPTTKINITSTSIAGNTTTVTKTYKF
jgi:transcriptional regulator with XRE-family HTH domain